MRQSLATRKARSGRADARDYPRSSSRRNFDVAADPLDDLFRDAVRAIDAGDLTTLEALLANHPRLACERLEALIEAGAQLDARDTVYDGTPLAWAEYSGSKSPYREIALFLRSRGAR